MRLHIPLLTLSLVVVPTPSFGQALTMTIFGEDKCPENAICVRAPERDRYRIPKNLREPLKGPESESWATRSQAAMSEGKSGIGSCSAVGSGGWTGCWLEQMKQAREEAKQNAPQ